MTATAPITRATVAVEPALLHAAGRPDERLLAGLGRRLMGDVLAVLICRGAEALRGQR